MLGRLIVGGIRLYQRGLSPLLPASCRFTPSCSEYAATAVGSFGPLKGGFLALRRLLRCHPFGSRGYDPVPEPSEGDGEAGAPRAGTPPS